MSQTPNPMHSLELNNDVVRVVQLTDSHLCKAEGGTLLGMDTDHSLQCVIELVEKEMPERDLVLGTGDLSDNGSAEAYDRIEQQFGRLGCESFWIPGNHDSRPHMEAAAQSSVRIGSHIQAGKWQILMLDSQIPGEVGGELGDAELAQLQQNLEVAQQQGFHVLICLHHQPIPIGCDWLDEQKVVDADAFFAVIDQYACVRGVLWGHVHQEHDSLRGDVRFLSSPSTCVQFAPNSEMFKADDLPPGYRRLDLHPDGRIETQVSRVWDVEFKVELDSGGYL